MDEIKVELDIRLPSLPNFLMVGNGELKSVSVRHFTKKDLQKIGEEWTRKLVAKSYENFERDNLNQ
jgi:hypothetical protein